MDSDRAAYLAITADDGEVGRLVERFYTWLLAGRSP
jgi:hypothetical protein